MTLRSDPPQFPPIFVGGWLLVCFLAIYLPDVGKGFVSDDFGWILHSRVHALHDVADFFFGNPPLQFYRPLVSLSFAASEPVFGLSPAAYAYVNIGLVLVTAGGIVALVRALGLPALSGVFAATLWMFNFHSIRMALLWISGRTSLMATCFAVFAAVAFVRRRKLLAGALTLCALLSKEEPMLLPLVFALWAWLNRSDTTPDARFSGSTVNEIARRAWPQFAALAMYFALRMQTNAHTPGTAPSYYKLTLAPGVLLPNVLSYLDRSTTLVAAVLLLGWLLFCRTRISLDSTERRTVFKGLVWLVLGFGVTVMVPVRSSLYVCLPAVGASLVAAAVGSALWRAIPAPKRLAAGIAVLILPLALIPVYRSRNVRSRAEAQLSAQVIASLRTALDARPKVQRIIIFDDPLVRPSVATSFGWALGTAIEVAAGRPLPVELESRTTPAEGASDATTLRFALQDGRLILL